MKVAAPRQGGPGLVRGNLSDDDPDAEQRKKSSRIGFYAKPTSPVRRIARMRYNVPRNLVPEGNSSGGGKL